MSARNNAILGVTGSDIFRFNAFYARGNTTRDGCVEWPGSRYTFGYGRFRIRGVTVSAPRLVCFLNTGVLGAVVLHSCDNPPCVNPQHLSWGTHADNTADRLAKGRDHQSQKTTCPRGHLLEEGNLVASKLALGHRECLICARDRARNHRNKKAEQ